MKKDNNHIDDLFKDAFDGMESPPTENLWDKISNDLSGEQVDDLFRDALSDESANPSEQVWDGVKENLPLDLRLKRGLSRLSYVAGVVVIGMLLITVYISLQDSHSNIPQEETSPLIDTEIAVEEVQLQEVEEEITIVDEQTVVKAKDLATDNTIDRKVKSIELKKEDEFVFDINEAKIRNILEPLGPLPIDSAVAKVNGNLENHTETEDGTLIPENFEETILPSKEEKNKTP